MPAIPRDSICLAWAVNISPGTNGVRKAHCRLMSFCMASSPEYAAESAGYARIMANGASRRDA